jgi:hypothetical protein
MPREYVARLHVAGEVYPIHRDVTREHPRAVPAALGTTSETELQQYLDDCHPQDCYGDDGQHLGPPDDSGLELRWAD